MDALKAAWHHLQQRLRRRIAEERLWMNELAVAIRTAGGHVLHALSDAALRLGHWLVHQTSAAKDCLRTIAAARPTRTWLVRAAQTALFLPLLFLVYHVLTQQTIFQEAPAFASAPQQRILIVHNAGDTYGERAYANVVRALDYARLNYDDLDLAAGATWPELERYSVLLFVTEFLDAIDAPQAQRIADYVAGGGGLVVAYRAWHPHLASLFGMVPTTDHPPLVESEGGLTFERDFFPGVKGLKLSSQTVPTLSPFDVPLQKNDLQVIARSATGRPIVWLYRHGQGRVIYWNTSFLAEKQARGFIVQSILNAQGVGVLPIANVATIQIDDFPAAVSTAKLEPIASEYDMTLVEFYDQVWFPDMMEIARRYGIVYTFFIPFNYNALVKPPFTFEEWEHARIQVDNQSVLYSVYVSHLAAQRHELGLHGYNHVSLTLENWGDEANMVAALQAAWERWDRDNLGPRPLAYVPPNNIYDAAGARALTQGFPSLRILAGLYLGHFEEGGDREFGPEPWNPQLFNLPRVTFGYNLTPRYRFAMLSALGMMGVWTHFMHPDDVIHTPTNYPDAPYHRNPNDWPWRGDRTGEKNGFYYRFLRWLDFVQTYYPWLRFTRTSESLDILRLHLNNRVIVETKPYALTLRTTPDTYFQVRINDGRRVSLNDLAGAQFVHVYHGEGYTLYTFRAVKERVSLPLLLPTRRLQRDRAPGVPTPVEPALEGGAEMPPELQDERIWQVADIPTPTPGTAPDATATPALDLLPQATPTLRRWP